MTTTAEVPLESYPQQRCEPSLDELTARMRPHLEQMSRMRVVKTTGCILYAVVALAFGVVCRQMFPDMRPAPLVAGAIMLWAGAALWTLHAAEQHEQRHKRMILNILDTEPGARDALDLLSESAFYRMEIEDCLNPAN